MGRLRALVEEGEASSDGTEVRVPHSVVARFDAALQAELGLPDLADLALRVGFEHTIDHPEARVTTEWLQHGVRPVIPVRRGLVVEIAGAPFRLSRELYDAAEAADGFNATLGLPVERRMAAWGAVQDAISRSTGGAVRPEGQAASLVLHQAGAFALDIEERADGLRITPVLMSRRRAVSLEDDAPIDMFGEEDLGGADGLADALLPEAQDAQFRASFASEVRAHAAYKLGRNSYVVLDPDLERALEVLQRIRRAPEAERRAFVRNPRRAIAEALSADDPHALATQLFVETKAYSDRVTGLGLWERPKLPWLTRAPNDWLPERVPVVIRGERAELTPEEAADIVRTVHEAEVSGSPDVDVLGGPLPIEEARRVRDDILKYERTQPEPGGPSAGQEDDPATAPADGTAASGKLVLTLKPNHEAPDYVAGFSPRPSLAPPVPDGLTRSSFKTHQRHGFDWLVTTWRGGWPGVLLADDMGLGKTFQALAFMAWLRANKRAAAERGEGRVAQGPFLVVAPTALLDNWKAEVERHLAHPGLGERLDAYGPGLRRLKGPDGEVDAGHLRRADWVLTTYETLAGAHTSFARVRFSLAIFDEVQKIKDPRTINAHAAKTVNTDFVLGMTGTPIENGLSDLWSITDALAPGYLGDLKTFTDFYQAERPDTLVALKRKLEESPGGAPPILLRRMKEDVLDGLPLKRVEPRPALMPPEQAVAYQALIDRARSQSGIKPGDKLRLIHEMRGISLHPEGPSGPRHYAESEIRAWIRRSARLSTALDVLEAIARRGEKALVFVESLEMQDAFAESAAVLFEMPRPAIINGGTPGAKRQQIVNRFQRAPAGFDLLVLSPKAAGVGLTITAANHVLHLSRWWNPAVEDQCNDRAYRIGQERDVTVHLPLAVHPALRDASFDHILDRLLARKRALSRTMLAPPSSASDIDEVFGQAVGGGAQT